MVIVLPGSTSSSSTSSSVPTSTRYCFPPVSMTAYMDPQDFVSATARGDRDIGQGEALGRPRRRPGIVRLHARNGQSWRAARMAVSVDRSSVDTYVSRCYRLPDGCRTARHGRTPATGDPGPRSRHRADRGCDRDSVRRDPTGHLAASHGPARSRTDRGAPGRCPTVVSGAAGRRRGASRLAGAVLGRRAGSPPGGGREGGTRWTPRPRRAADATTAIEREVRIAAPPETVFGFFTDGARMARWMGRTVTLDPRPGGALRIDYNGSDIAAGTFVEIDPPRRIVFTLGLGDARRPGAARREHGRGDLDARRCRHPCAPSTPGPAGRVGRGARRGLGPVPARVGDGAPRQPRLQASSSARISRSRTIETTSSGMPASSPSAATTSSGRPVPAPDRSASGARTTTGPSLAVTTTSARRGRRSYANEAGALRTLAGEASRPAAAIRRRRVATSAASSHRRARSGSRLRRPGRRAAARRARRRRDRRAASPRAAALRGPRGPATPGRRSVRTMSASSRSPPCPTGSGAPNATRPRARPAGRWTGRPGPVERGLPGVGQRRGPRGPSRRRHAPAPGASVAAATAGAGRSRRARRSARRTLDPWL